MKLNIMCLSCKTKITVDFTGTEGVGQCPKCGGEIRFPEETVEYKILTQEMLCDHLGFNKPAQAEGMLNALALEGWRVVGCMTQAITSLNLSSFMPSGVIVLQRPVKRLT